jgi:peroxin-11B
MTFDFLAFPDAAGIKKSATAKDLQKKAYTFWMIGLLFSVASGTYSLYNLRQQQARVEKTDGEGVVASKRIEKYVFRLGIHF